MLVSSEPLDQMAAQSYASLCAESAQKGVLNHDAVLTQRARTVDNRLEPNLHIGGKGRHRPS